jgi:hypothetical protein
MPPPSRPPRARTWKPRAPPAPSRSTACSTTPGWATAGRATAFAERFPGDGTEPPVQTEAWLTYDDENLYVAFICRDDPSLLRATMTQRDIYGNDDEVGLLLDTFGEGHLGLLLLREPVRRAEGRHVDQRARPLRRVRHGLARGSARAGRRLDRRTGHPPGGDALPQPPPSSSGASISGADIPARAAGSTPGAPTTATSSACPANGVRSAASPA